MRLTELTLENYGNCASREISIPDGPGLTVIYGPNEAGKSTCLEAISDFLFSIPKNTQRGSLFGYDGMRLGASMQLSDSTTLTFKRRKGSGKTLSDASGTALDDAALAPVLGTIDRDRFTTLFGLNHESLRNGGERLLAADGDIGKLIVEAGGGLRTLVSRLEGIDAEADKLFDTRKSASRAFYQHLTTFDAADRAARGAQITRETYEQARKALTGSKEKLEAVRAERRALATAAGKFERVLRVAPHLRQLDSQTEALAHYEDIANLPSDFAVNVTTALETRNQAQLRLEAAAGRRDRLKARLDALEVNKDLQASETRIRDIAERAINVRKARTDRPNRARDMQEGEVQLGSLRRMLGLEGQADLAALTPDQSALNSVRRLADEMNERRPALAAAKAALSNVSISLGALDERLKIAREAGYDKPADATSSALANLAAQRPAIEVRGEAFVTDQANLEQRVASLGFHSLDALVALPCPGEEDIRKELSLREGLVAKIDEQQRLKREAQLDQTSAEAEIDELQVAGTIANAASLAAARSHRSDAWSPIKIAFVSGDVLDDAADRLSAADKLDAAISTSDELADRRASEAEAAAALAHAQARITATSSKRTAAEAEISALAAKLDGNRADWAKTFPVLVARETELLAQLQFVQTRQQIIDEAARLRSASDALRLEDAQLTPAVEQMERVELKYGLDPSLSLSARVSGAQAAIQRHEQEHGDFVRDLRAREEGVQRQKLFEAELVELNAARLVWDAVWPAATAALSLPPDVSPADAMSAVTEWAGARGHLTSIGQARQRLARMDEDEAELARDVADVTKALAMNVSENCVAAAEMLKERFDSNAKVQAQFDEQRPSFDEAKVETEQAEADLGVAREKIETLIGLVRGIATDETGLRLVAERIEVRVRLCNTLAQMERTAIDVGDALDLAMLRTEWATRDLEDVRAELADVHSRAADLEQELETAVRDEKAAQDALAAFGAQSDFNHAVAEREAATAQMHLALERYLQLSVAKELVTTAMATIRAEQQDPLIQRASELFSAATLGEFAGIETDIDDKGNPVVVGRRANGGMAAVSTMSDGTRDQLFLAFRLASLENYGSATEPLPFIADDILVHFDDDRSRSTLQLLAEFGKANQVLLFTHHRSVRTLVEPLEQQGIANLLDLMPTRLGNIIEVDGVASENGTRLAT